MVLRYRHCAGYILYKLESFGKAPSKMQYLPRNNIHFWLINWFYIYTYSLCHTAGPAVQVPLLLILMNIDANQCSFVPGISDVSNFIAFYWYLVTCIMQCHVVMFPDLNTPWHVVLLIIVTGRSACHRPINFLWADSG